jgi:hypothetical protein
MSIRENNPPPPIPSWPLYPPPPLPTFASTTQAPAKNSQTSWSGTLIFACLVIGLLAGMLELERSRYKSERDRAMQMMTSVELLQAREERLGKNLSDNGTQLIRLSSSLESGPQTASLAYNLTLRWGALICDQLPPLPDGQHYQIWAVTGGNAIQLADIDPKPGVSVYPFHFDSTGDKFDRIEITAGPRATDQPALFTGDLNPQP